MHIEIEGQSGLAVAVAVLLATLLLGVAAGYLLAGKRRYMAHRKQFKTECDKRSLALDEREFLQERKQEEQNERERQLNELQFKLDDKDRDLASQEADMDQRMAALADRERTQAVSLS